MFIFIVSLWVFFPPFSFYQLSVSFLFYPVSIPDPSSPLILSHRCVFWDADVTTTAVLHSVWLTFSGPAICCGG